MTRTPAPAPALPLPEPLRGNQAGTFAADTVTRRMPAIVRRVPAENALHAEAAAAVAALADEILDAPIRHLRDPGAPDAAAWARYAEPYVGERWADAPWFFAETYMFRRILEATGYFQPGPGRGRDPYAAQKAAGLGLAERDHLPPAAGHAAPDLAALILRSLWGNQADLSLWPAEEGGRPVGAAPGAERLLADDSAALAEHIARLASRGGRADLVLDNAGEELLGDLALADGMLALGARVALHAKPHPTYVSDVTEPDLAATLAWLRGRPAEASRAMGERLAAALAAGRLTVRADWFWTSPLAGWEMPAALRAELAGGGLIVSKGDANYRRWLGDRAWPFDAPLAGALAYAPAPLALLRTCKSEVAAGLAPERIAAAAALDPAWVTNGRWGVVQLVGA